MHIPRIFNLEILLYQLSTKSIMILNGILLNQRIRYISSYQPWISLFETLQGNYFSFFCGQGNTTGCQFRGWQTAREENAQYLYNITVKQNFDIWLLDKHDDEFHLILTSPGMILLCRLTSSSITGWLQSIGNLVCTNLSDTNYKLAGITFRGHGML